MKKEKSIKKVSIKDVVKDTKEKKDINMMDIINLKYPECGEDYAIQLWFKTYHNVFAKCSAKSLDEDMETAHLVIDGKNYIVNIRTSKITLI